MIDTSRAVILVSLVALAACNSPSATPPASTPVKVAAAGTAVAAATAAAVAPAAPAKGAYEVKSGIIEMKNSMMDGMKTTIYFDDYGAKQATESTMTMKMMGQEIKTDSWDIKADGWSTQYDAIKKTGSRFKMPAGMSAAPAGMPDVKTMSEDMKKNMKELPEKTIAGKPAKGMQMKAMGMDMKSWSWKGIPLYTETDMSGGKGKPIIMEATSVKEQDVPADKFKAPADVKIEEKTL